MHLQIISLRVIYFFDCSPSGYSNIIFYSPTGGLKFWSKILNKGTNEQKYSLWSYLFVQNTTQIKISASQRISIKNCMSFDHNKNCVLFQSGYKKLYLNSPKGYSRKIINAQTAAVISKTQHGVPRKTL